MSYTKRLQLHAQEVTSNVSVGDDVLVKEIRYNPALPLANRDDALDFDNDLTFDSEVPIRIYSYEWEIISSCLVYAYQTYIQKDAGSVTYDPDNYEYLRAEKQFQVVPGTQHFRTTKSETDDGIVPGGDYQIEETDTTSTARWVNRKIKFQAKKKKNGKGWKIPPITLAPNKLDTMQFRFYVRNTNGASSADVYSVLRIKSWELLI